MAVVRQPRPVSPAVVRRPTTATRMIGWNAGLPQGSIVDRTLITTGAIPLRGEAPTDYQRNGTTVRVRGFERHPVVMACVRAIVDVASAVPLQFYRKAQGKNGREVVDVLPSTFEGQRLVDAPSSFLSSQRLRAITFTHYLVYGNSLWYLERPIPAREDAPPEPPIGLRLVHPEDLTTVYVNAKGYPLWYLWRDVLGYPHTSPVQDLVHFRDLNAKGFVFGYPRAASALNDIIGDDEASQHVRQVVTNAGVPSAVAIMEPEADVSDAKLAEERFYEKMVSRGGRGRFAFMGGVKEIKAMGFSLKDLEFPDLRRVSREDICAAFGVDPRMVGITSASRDAGLSGTQYSEARTRLIQQTIEPMMRAFESELNLWLAPEFGDVYLRFDPDVLQALVEDDETTTDRVIKQVQSGLRTLEQGRDVLDIEEPEPDDTYATLTTTQFIPVVVAGQEPTTPPAAQGGTGADGGGDPGAGTGEPEVDEGTQATQGNEGGEAALAATTGQNPNDPGKTPKFQDGSEDPKGKKRSAALVSTAAVHRRGVVLSPENRLMLWSAFDQRATTEEAPFRRTALMLFGEERSQVARLVEQQQGADPARAGKVLRNQLGAMYKPGGEARRRWVDRMHPVIATVYAKGAEHVMSGLRSTRADGSVPNPDKPPYNASFNLHDPKAQQSIRERATKLADYVGQTTGDAVTAALEIGLREGMSTAEIGSLIDKTAFGGSAGYRANMIARTESIGALNQGQFDAAMESGAIAGKEWLTQGDTRVRDSHAMCEAQGMVALDEPFDNGLMHPGDQDGPPEEVINCRCTLLYYDELTGDTQPAGEDMDGEDA